jgi:folylpolyglutamate synthase/dihydropteroate synthase
MYQQSSEVMRKVEKVVADKQATLHVLQGSEAVHFSQLPLFQQRNLGLASHAVDYVLRRDYQEHLTHDMLHHGAEIVIPARLERFTVRDKVVIVDGSHNQQKIETLLDSIEQLYPGRPIAVLCAFAKGNDNRWQAGLNVLIERARHIIFTSFQTEKDVPKTSIEPSELLQFCERHGFSGAEVNSTPADAYHTLLSRSEPVLLVTGSFYLLNHIRPLVKEQS